MAARGFRKHGSVSCNQKYEFVNPYLSGCNWHPRTGWLDRLRDDLHDEAQKFAL
jgi:hypothetical protein